ncbi:MAG: hypothetical protein JW730_18175 [Anaerolineales bacterium]|nr:hypothetical protein [Anaerolineales bacterium]
MAATGSGYLVPRPPLVAPNAAVSAQATTASLVIADYGKNITNTGASGTIVLTLLAAASAAGKSLRIQITNANIVRLLPQAGEAIYLGGSGVVTKYLNIAAVIGNYCELYCDGERYLVTGYSGVVTKEA